MPYAQCPMPHAQCPRVPHLSEKGYRYLLMESFKFRSGLPDFARANSRESLLNFETVPKFLRWCDRLY